MPSKQMIKGNKMADDKERKYNELIEAIKNLLKALEPRMMRTGASPVEEIAFKKIREAIERIDGKIKLDHVS